jgi:hypothetical protein
MPSNIENQSEQELEPNRDNFWSVVGKIGPLFKFP